MIDLVITDDKAFAEAKAAYRRYIMANGREESTRLYAEYVKAYAEYVRVAALV